MAKGNRSIIKNGEKTIRKKKNKKKKKKKKKKKNEKGKKKKNSQKYFLETKVKYTIVESTHYHCDSESLISFAYQHKAIEEG